jgi:phytoene dehydrogenase-like protein
MTDLRRRGMDQAATLEVGRRNSTIPRRHAGMTSIPNLRSRDAIVVGSGPNGLAAAIHLARAGLSVTVLEAQQTIGGAARSFELTLPGFVHDFGSAVLPLGVASPFFRTLPLRDHGVEWIHPDIPLAHPFDDGSAAILDRSVDVTATRLGSDAAAYRQLMEPFVSRWDKLLEDVLAPARIPRHPLTTARFGLSALRSVRGLAESRFLGVQARALLAGLGAHSFLPLEKRPSAGFALSLGFLGHGVGWPFPRGGVQSLTTALAAHLTSLGGEILTGVEVRDIGDLPDARATLFDVTPRQLIAIAADSLPSRYVRRLQRYRYGPGVFKVDYALDAPIPWTAVECGLAGTVHLGGTLEEIAHGERTVWRGEHPERPFVLLAQPSLFDSTRAPQGKHTAWAYCHVPNSSIVDMTEHIEAQIERFAPGFQDRILARSALSPRDLEDRDANLVGGDINGGLQDLRQLLTRPVFRLDPYSTPVRSIYICSSSTPPGGGVHGMCGYFAARSALRRSR